MAIVEAVPDEPSTPSSTRQRRKPQSNTIPLVHPSTLPSSSAAPLIPPSPDGEYRQASPTPSEIDELLRAGGVVPEPADERERDIWDEVFDTAILTIPFSFLYLLLDILVYMQYSFKPKTADIVAHMARAVPTLAMITWYTSKYSTHFATNPLLMTASLFTGCRLIWLLNKASWGVVTAQASLPPFTKAPAMGAVWTLTIVQLPLSRAVLCLFGVAAWCWCTGMKLQT
ncbi:uncharacterized protein MKK02DRAFT_39631 [Dioszegia hungarica]|uniref:DUF7719 domain-containing protein n=1 Tax=Dioszegia hungarica TaxID=4972 RepID=A0AA38HDT2_9TREE|nr:uncharacterized protein MKK02DRAFT_39631 [Dioszegia hungarica]KAI9639332.1 hypothetical protein MKK02DRAFT_39631 [Dioszegia hungarica]